MSLVKDIGELLAVKGHGAVGVDIYCGDIPDEPDHIIGIFEYAGKTPDSIAGLEHPGLQIRCRDRDYESARDTMQGIQNLLIRIGDADDEDYREGVTLNDIKYLRIAPVQGAFPLGRDHKERMEFAQNYEITLRR